MASPTGAFRNIKTNEEYGIYQAPGQKVQFDRGRGSRPTQPRGSGNPPKSAERTAASLPGLGRFSPPQGVNFRFAPASRKPKGTPR